jgi:peptidoglycan/LPS O-acetylase OafA/YrhL
MAPKKHFYWLDWMRFIAAFMVVVCHSRVYNWVEWGSLAKLDQTPVIKLFFASTRAGLEWVVVFFVLSGFLVGGGVISRCLKGVFDFRLFAIDRVSRIWVPLIPALLLSLGVALFCGLPVSLPDMVGNALGLQGIFFKNFAHNEPLWSLSYEIWFYVLIGAVGVILPPKSRSRVVALFVLFTAFMVFTRLSPNFLNCWLLGAFSYFLVSERKRPAVLILALALAFLGAAISQLQSDSLSISKSAWMSLLPGRLIATLTESLGIGLLVASICRIQPTSKLLITVEKAGTSLAAFSYTLYLTHYPILGLWEHFVPERSPVFTLLSCLIFVAKICSCLLMGWLFYLPFEAKTPEARAWIRSRWVS